jgi:hypothetical protein
VEIRRVDQIEIPSAAELPPQNWQNRGRKGRVATPMMPIFGSTE